MGFRRREFARTRDRPVVTCPACSTPLKMGREGLECPVCDRRWKQEKK